jgi:hypothetical protein
VFVFAFMLMFTGPDWTGLDSESRQTCTGLPFPEWYCSGEFSQCSSN